MSQVKEQTADYQLADLSPALKAAEAGNVLLESLPVWLSAQTRKSAGRGRSVDNMRQYGVQKLRELVLELAVSGKLVEQDPNDEPASILLEKIAEEKVRLIKEGVAKKEKKLPPISEDEEPYEIPHSWLWARLPEVYISISPSGKKLKTSELKETGKYPVVDQGQSHIAGYFDDESLLVEIPNPVVVFGDHTKARKYIDFNFIPGADGTKILCPVKIFPRYFYLHLLAYNLEDRGYGRHFKILNSNTFATPPLAEQHRIVKKVDELMALCDQLELQQTDAVQAHETLVKVLLNTLTQSETAEDFQQNWRRIAEHFDTLFTTESSIDQLKQTLLQLAVMGKLVPQDPNDEPASVLLEKVSEEKARLVKEGKIKKQNDLPEISVSDMPFIHPYGWIFSRTQSLCLKITDGEHATPRRAESGQYLLSARNITNEGISLSDVDFVPDEEFERIRKRCDPNIGDILISCSGSVGRVALVDKDDAYSMVRSAAMIRPTPSYLSKEYLCIMYKSPFLQEQMQKGSKKSAQANLFLGAISNLIAIIPPLAEQHRIVKKVDELMALCDHLKDRLNQAQTLKQHLADAVVESTITLK